MRRWSTAAAVLTSLALVVSFGLLTVASADDDDDDDDKGRGNKNNKSSFALFDGTNPATEAPPNGGAECTVKGPATLYASVTAHSSGPAGFVRVTFKRRRLGPVSCPVEWVIQLYARDRRNEGRG